MLRPLWGLRLGAVEPDVSCRARVPSALSRKSHLSVSGWWHDRGTQVLEDAVLAGLKSRLMAPELFKELCEEYYREVNRLRGEENATLETQRAELARIQRRTRKLVELITEDDAPVKVLKQELKDLEARQAELERALAVATAPTPLIHPSLAEVYRQKVAAMHEALHDATSRDEVLRRRHPFPLQIEIRGELAGT